METRSTVCDLLHGSDGANCIYLSISLRMWMAIMGKLIPYKTFIARRGAHEIKRLKDKERRDRARSINRLLGYANTLGDWPDDNNEGKK